jgi:beta-galactosidase/beta-glucuronidase
MEREYTRVGSPMLTWKWKHNPGPESDSLPWTAPDFADKDWPTTQIVRDTWSDLGLHSALTDAASGRSGRMAYRATQKLPALPAGKKVYLWIGATDGSAKVFVNGTEIKYLTPGKGEEREAFSGYCRSAQFDITAAVKTGENQFTILCDRTGLNELGTGGLMGPVILYREK